MSRTIPTTIAALCAGALLAGCGASSSAPAKSSAPSSSAASASSAASSGGVSSSLVTSSDPKTAGSLSSTKLSSVTSSTLGKVTTTSLPGVTTPSATSTTTTATTTTASTTKTTTNPASPSSSSKTTASASTPHTASSSGSSGAAERPVVVIHTVTVPEMPQIPAGAFLPGTEYADATHFDTYGGQIGCEISGGVARCDIAKRIWAPPARPKSCQLDWGQGIDIGSTGSPSFVCAGDSVLDPTGKLVPDGWDDKVGSLTCEVRSFGVSCFQDGTSGHGFTISRTGYTFF